MKYEGYNRLGEEKINNQGCPMIIVEYIDSHNIIVEFLDKYKYKVHTNYFSFLKGTVKNLYYPSICNVGITGNKYEIYSDNKERKEYRTWKNVIYRSFDEKIKYKQPTYKDIICCKEWLLYENFYEWLHSQKNFDKWLNGKNWAIDKDILFKGNKIYSPEMCCLVPQSVNSLFTKSNFIRGQLPIGVSKKTSGFSSSCRNPILNKWEHLGYYSTPEEAFFAYKKYKENIIKQVAQIEFNKENITKECYQAMMNYEVEIDD